ncbi:hypothetical protein MSG28_014110 [Choristoneura fumiferana]|uniref:Uncharacterized protein n=1 Tax=Choristoneura fumiferana TaxID=7141 RepID=A0ACC0JG19_CHOFU|nr:hypothetical protein MSG28_014110 [Choristoneura fumiferana]
MPLTRGRPGNRSMKIGVRSRMNRSSRRRTGEHRSQEHRSGPTDVRVQPPPSRLRPALRAATEVEGALERGGWTIPIPSVAGKYWTRKAEDRKAWRQLEEAYTRKRALTLKMKENNVRPDNSCPHGNLHKSVDYQELQNMRHRWNWKQTRDRPRRPGAAALLHTTTPEAPKMATEGQRTSMGASQSAFVTDEEVVDQLFKDTGFNPSWRKSSP